MFRTFFVLGCVGLASWGCTPGVSPADPEVPAPGLNTTAYVAADGARLPMRRWLPDGRVRAVILALHGFNDYSKAFESPARFWAGQGIATYAYDQRGFGDAPRPGIWAGIPALTADVRDVAAALRQRHPGVPLYLVGVSMGAAVSIVALAGSDPPDVDGAVLVAPAVWARNHMSDFSRWLLWAMSGTVPWLEVSGEGLDIMPSDNIEMLRALGRDEKVIKYTRIDAIDGLVDLMDLAFAEIGEVTVPALVLYGAHDEVVPRDAVYDALRRIPPDRPVRVAVYPHGYHMLLRDLQAETVWRDIVAWIRNRKAPLPSGAERDPHALIAAR